MYQRYHGPIFSARPLYLPRRARTSPEKNQAQPDRLKIGPARLQVNLNTILLRGVQS